MTIIEKWESLDALKAHFKTQHFLEYRKRVKDFVKNTTVHVLRGA